MNPNSTRNGAFVKMNGYCLRDLLLQISQILPLRRNATRSVRIVPRSNEPARIFVALDLKCDFFHHVPLLFHSRTDGCWVDERLYPNNFAFRAHHPRPVKMNKAHLL
jgi:hypothetical protein